MRARPKKRISRDDCPIGGCLRCASKRAAVRTRAITGRSMTSGTIRQPLRMLLLPSRPGTESASARALKRALTGLHIAPADFLRWVELQLQNWRLSGNAPTDLRRVVQSVILASVADATGTVAEQGARLADGYFALHGKLMDEHLMNHEEAVAFLSHSFLIAHLAAFERLSAAQIANVLSQRDRRAKFSRQCVDAALQAMRVASDLSKEQVISLYRRDASQELATLADADLLTAAESVADAGSKLGFPGNLLEALKTLAPECDLGGIRSAFTPYLQMLHYQCSLAEFVDHAVTDVYEFSPRGEKGEWLHRQYPHTIAGAANPFLNNAKSVEVLDVGWVRAKKTRERPGAMALLMILEGMQAMGFSARRELAWWIRLWLHRIIRIAGMVPVEIPERLTHEQIARLMQEIANGNTRTFGILEQRAIDAVATTIHAGWRARGVGDPVNATNISTAKLGDCDFLDVATTSVHAYESHGGALSPVYVEQHLATLRKSILRRIDELTAVADVDAWEATIHFVAHEIIGELPAATEVHGLNIRITAMTFADFLSNTLRMSRLRLLPQWSNMCWRH
ncbi:hypothetical protein C7S16_3740 [Burkholderia thailandensis]|uniref:Uncharacterized protein n=1 Tax=Burkholderia thailandensis TaxID=57975 RepID=A0AAW9D0P5_BURTH|nr:hypothetical protein [Burkholderia thailandensis]MDW9256718.1 hypothetical protein [Burkholderia thailandensis]